MLLRARDLGSDPWDWPAPILVALALGRYATDLGQSLIAARLLIESGNPLLAVNHELAAMLAERAKGAIDAAIKADDEVAAAALRVLQAQARFSLVRATVGRPEGAADVPLAEADGRALFELSANPALPAGIRVAALAWEGWYPHDAWRGQEPALVAEHARRVEALLAQAPHPWCGLSARHVLGRLFYEPGLAQGGPEKDALRRHLDLSIEGLEALLAALEGHPAKKSWCGELHRYLGDAYGWRAEASIEEPERCLHDARREFELRKTYVDYAVLLWRLGRLEQLRDFATSEAEEARQVLRADVYALLAIAEAEGGNPEAARTALRKALGRLEDMRQANDEEAWQTRPYVEMAKARVPLD
jgi:hypothetical protein